MKLVNLIIEIGKGGECPDELLHEILPNLPTISGGEEIFSINKLLLNEQLGPEPEFLIKGLHYIEIAYKKEYKNSFGIGSPWPTAKAIDKLNKVNPSKAMELESWVAENGGNYYISPK